MTSDLARVLREMTGHVGHYDRSRAGGQTKSGGKNPSLLQMAVRDLL